MRRVPPSRVAPNRVPMTSTRTASASVSRSDNPVIVVEPVNEVDVILDKGNEPVRADDPRWVPATRYIRTP